jgi:hypothetical protein
VKRKSGVGRTDGSFLAQKVDRKAVTDGRLFAAEHRSFELA